MILNPGVLALNSMFFILYSVWVSTLMCVFSYIDILNFILIEKCDFEKHSAGHSEDFHMSFVIFSWVTEVLSVGIY